MVLTPSHITELFCDLAELTYKDIVYDPCCGTGGFLVSALERMFSLAGNNQNERKKIREKRLCGVEIRADMFTYACSNMKFRGDGKSNIFIGDCFAYEDMIKEYKPTVSFLNPPYDHGLEKQMEFIEHSLNVVSQKGIVVAIVQQSCAFANRKELNAIKQRIKKHTLKAVLSMPDELFYPVGVVSCIMVFIAGVPNKDSKTFLGYFKDDGFEKKKNLGRVDWKNQYNQIKNKWLKAYKNQEEIDGFSVNHEMKNEIVDGKIIYDEWCAEAYLKTDYSKLAKEHFQDTLNKYVAFLISNNITLNFTNYNNICNRKLDIQAWWEFKIDKLFKCESTKMSVKSELENGHIPFISRTAENNGVDGFVEVDKSKITKGNCLTIGAEGVKCFYQPTDFATGNKVYVLRLDTMNVHIGLFLATVLNLECFRYGYGRARVLNKLKNETIKLPIQHKNGIPIKDNTKKYSEEGYLPDFDFMESYINGCNYGNMI